MPCGEAVAGAGMGSALPLLLLIAFFRRRAPPVAPSPASFRNLFQAGLTPLPVVPMEGKKVLAAGITGGVLLFVALFGFSFVASLLAPYRISNLPGMRQDWVMNLFFAFPSSSRSCPPWPSTG